MVPLLLKHLASSLTRQVAQMHRFNLPFSSAYRCLWTLTAAPRTGFLSSAGTGSVRGPSSGPSALCGPSLLGRCQRLPCVQQSAGMKTKGALKRRCKDCFIVRRRGNLYVYCKTNPRHKQKLL